MKACDFRAGEVVFSRSPRGNFRRGMVMAATADGLLVIQLESGHTVGTPLSDVYVSATEPTGEPLKTVTLPNGDVDAA